MDDDKIPLIVTKKTEYPIKETVTVTLKRNLTLWHCLVTVVGCLLGSGLYISPALVAKGTPNSFISLSVWIFAGFISLLGSLCYCELTTVIKKTGSSYIFVHDTYGKYFSLPLLISMVFIVVPFGLGVVLLTASTYLCEPFLENIHHGNTIWIIRGVALNLLVLVTIISCFGAKESTKVQIFIGILQVGSVLTLFVTAIYCLIKTNNFHNFKPNIMFNGTLKGLREDFSSIGLSVFSALFCFDGWFVIASFAEEIENPRRNLPIIAISGIPFVTFLYSLINLSCLAMLTHKEMGSSEVVFIKALEKAQIPYIKYIIPICVCCSCLSNVFSCFFYQSRFILSAAREGSLPKFLALIDTKRSTPIPAILLQAILIAIVTICGFNIEKAMQYYNSAIWLEYFLAFSVVLYLRYKEPLADRTYKVWISTAVFMTVLSLVLLLFLVYQVPFSGLLLAIIIISSTVFNRCIKEKFEKHYTVSERFCDWLCEKTGLVVSDVNMDGWE